MADTNSSCPRWPVEPLVSTSAEYQWSTNQRSISSIDHAGSNGLHSRIRKTRYGGRLGGTARQIHADTVYTANMENTPEKGSTIETWLMQQYIANNRHRLARSNIILRSRSAASFPCIQIYLSRTEHSDPKEEENTDSYEVS